MRCLLLFLAVSFTAGLSAQAKVDTIFNRWGELNQIRYSSAMDKSEINKADLFMRGMSADEPIYQLDSIRLVNKNGETKIITGEEMNDIPVPGSMRSTYQNSVRRAAREKAEKHAGITSTDYVEGRAGMRVRRTVLSGAAGKSVTNMKRLDDSPEIELMETHTAENGDLKAKVYIPAGAVQRKLILDFGDGKKWEKLYTIRGYHLNESDFRRKGELTEEQTWRAEGRDYLYLRLRSTEKLLYISRGETRYKPIPVGRQLDEVYLKGLAAGKYLMEIIDLGTKEKRFHWLVIGE